MLQSVVNMLSQAVRSLCAMVTMAERIKVLRQGRGLSVDDLADRCGVSRSAVYQWEQGAVEGIKPINFVRLLYALQTTADYLVWGADGPPKSDPSFQAVSRSRR